MTTWIFYLPLALIGFPTWMFVTVATFNTLYQFWIHTQLIHKMGWFEKIFNTPSHHRVHHGKNQQYIDKNYAGSLIIWDKLFGTFEPEAIQADYGVTEPLDSWNPFYANIKVIKDVLYYSQYLKSPLLAVRAFLMPPEWILQQLEKQQIETIKRPSVQKNKKSPLVYMIVNTGFTLSIYSYLSLTYNPKTLLSWTLIALIALSLYILGSVANGNLKIKFIEFSRVLLMFISLILMTNNYILGLVVGILFYALNQFLFNLQSAFDPVTYVRGT
jgi:hypothetical protein